MNVKEYLNQKNLIFRDAVNNEILLKDCPFCADQKWHFYMNKDGLYHCKKCFVKDSYVWILRKGLTRIQDVRKGHYILTPSGYFRKVLDSVKKQYTGELITFSLKGVDFSCTADHILFGCESEYCKYRNDKKKCFFCKNQSCPQFFVPKISEIKAIDYKSSDFLYSLSSVKKRKSVRLNLNKYNYEQHFGPKPKKIPKEILKDNDFYWVLGFYVAEGCTGVTNVLKNRGIHFANFDIKLKMRVYNFFKKYDFIVKLLSNGVWVSNTRLNKLFAELCGRPSNKKHFPYFVLGTIYEDIVFEGYYAGDGNKSRYKILEPKKNGRISTVSKELALQVYWLIAQEGLDPIFTEGEKYIDKWGNFHQKSYAVGWSSPKRRRKECKGFRRLKNIKHKKVKNIDVYDLTVEKDHSYLLNTIAVHNCGEKGNMVQFQRIMGDEPQIKRAGQFLEKTILKAEDIESLINKMHEELFKTEYALKYLTSRGITEETIKKFKLGYENDWISIPHYVNKRPISIKYRKISQKEYKRLYGTPSVLFNLDNLKSDLDYVIITEGEFDTIKGTQEGIVNIIGTTTGAESFQDRWIPLLKRFKKIYICFDSDETGRRGAQKVAEILGLDRCFNIILPEKDLNDYLLKYATKEFEEIFKKSKSFEISEIKKISETMKGFDEWVENREDIRGLETGFEDLDKILMGLKNEDLIIISGASTTGKTTLLLNMINSMLKQGKKVLAFLLEGRVFYFIQRLMTIEESKTFEDIDAETYKNLKEQFKNYNLYFYTGPQSLLDINKMIEKAKSCKKLYDIDLLILDHLHKIVPRGRDNYFALVGRTVADLKSLAADLKIPVMVVCHIRKVSRKEVPTMQDLRDSSFIHQDADVILMLWSDLENPVLRDNTILKVLKNKTGQDGVDFFFRFNRKTGEFIPIKQTNDKQ